MKYFIVTTKCGHVGKWNCIWIDFAVAAESATEAAQRAKTYKRVKRHHKDVIARVEEVTFEEFMSQISKNSVDPYLHCKNIRQQQLIENICERMQPDTWNIERHFKKQPKKKCKEYIVKKNKIAEMEWAKQIEEYEEDAA